MAQIPNTKIYLNKEQQEEYDRFAAASARVMERARSDKNVALQFLKDIGYFEIMAAEAAEQAAEAAAAKIAADKAAAQAAVHKVHKTVQRKPKSSALKPAKSKRGQSAMAKPGK